MKSSEVKSRACPCSAVSFVKNEVKQGGLSEGREGTCRIQNPDIPRAGRVGVPGETAGRGRPGLDANRIVRSIKTLGARKAPEYYLPCVLLRAPILTM